MGHLIDNLPAFSRLSRQPLNKQPIATADLVRLALDSLSSERHGRQVKITLGALPCARVIRCCCRKSGSTWCRTRSTSLGGGRWRALKLGAWTRRVNGFTLSKTTARALTCNTRASCSVCFSTCIERTSLRGRRLGWRRCSGSSTVTAGGCGPSQTGQERALLFISSCRLHQRPNQVSMSQDALLQSDRAIVARGNYVRAEKIFHAASFSG